MMSYKGDNSNADFIGKVYKVSEILYSIYADNSIVRKIQITEIYT